MNKFLFIAGGLLSVVMIVLGMRTETMASSSAFIMMALVTFWSAFAANQVTGAVSPKDVESLDIKFFAWIHVLALSMLSLAGLQLFFEEGSLLRWMSGAMVVSALFWVAAAYGLVVVAMRQRP